MSDLRDHDMTRPTAALYMAVDDAIAAKHITAEQDQLLDAYFDVTCGDCKSGRCHWGGQASADSIAAAEDGREYHERCGCARHEVSVRWRIQNRLLEHDKANEDPRRSGT